jgi:hypothetical protein
MTTKWSGEFINWAETRSASTGGEFSDLMAAAEEIRFVLADGFSEDTVRSCLEQMTSCAHVTAAEVETLAWYRMYIERETSRFHALTS